MGSISRERAQAVTGAMLVGFWASPGTRVSRSPCWVPVSRQTAAQDAQLESKKDSFRIDGRQGQQAGRDVLARCGLKATQKPFWDEAGLSALLGSPGIHILLQ